MPSHGDTWLVLLPWLGLALGVLCLLFALRNGARGRVVDDTPTSKTTGVFIGLAELKGTAEVESPLTSFLSECACVYYSWTVEEHWSRTVVETYTDGNGHSQTRTRTESGWTNVGGETQQIPFYLKDDCGVMLVQPAQAKIEPTTVFSETCTPLNSLYYQKGPGGVVANSTFSRRFIETAIPLHTPLYLMGHARERQDIVAPEVAYDAQTAIFLISTRTEAQVSSGYRWGYWGLAVLGLVLTTGAMFVAAARTDAPNFAIPVLAALGYLAAWCLGWVWMVYNSLVNLRQRARQAWSNVDVQLKRRHDLIPSLVAVVEGLRDYERTVQSEVTRLRAEQTATPPGQTGADHGACFPVVAAIVERYPELKSSDSFQKLMQNLSDTEQRIALARGYFNDIATFFNNRLQIVPDRFVATLGAMRPQTLMAANDFERAPVQVKLAR